MVQKLDELLKLRGIKQAAFERSTLLSENRISKWKNGQGEPSATEALRMARALRVSLEWLIDDESDEPPREELTAGDARLLWAVRALGLDAEEALRLIDRGRAMPAAPKSPGAPQKPEVIQTSKQGEGSSPKRGAR
jgi:transcriptional regulator with XRE-family HTH domain